MGPYHIIDPGKSLNIPKPEISLFQFFASIASDLLWFTINMVIHDNPSPDARLLATQI
jgi:hypothetical protein